MAQVHNLTYTCPSCGHTFKEPCIFASSREEYERCKSQLSVPFAENQGDSMCFHQLDCPGDGCSESRQYPVLIEGHLEV